MATPATEIYPLSLHDALPIWVGRAVRSLAVDHRALQDQSVGNTPLQLGADVAFRGVRDARADRKSTRLNSSHQIISYAVFCLKKKKGINRSNMLCNWSRGPHY